VTTLRSGTVAKVDCPGRKMLSLVSYRGETALQGALVLAKSGRLKLGDNILQTLYVNLQPL